MATKRFTHRIGKFAKRANPLRKTTGKFSYVLDELFYHAWNSGFTDEDIGDVQTYGAYGLFVLNPDDVDYFNDLSIELTGEPLTDEERELVASSVGAIIYEGETGFGETGFVELEFFSDRERLDSAWNDIVAFYTKDIDLEDY